MATQTGSTYNSESMTDDDHHNSNNKPGVFIHGELEKMSIGDSDNDWQSEMDSETDNTYISETMR